MFHRSFLLLAVLTASSALPQLQATLIQNDQQTNWLLDSASSIDSDYIYSFCDTNSPNCLPSPVTMTSAVVHLALEKGLTNVHVSLNVSGPTPITNLACSGPTTVSTGADFTCLFPTSLTDTKTIGTNSHYTFTPVITFTPLHQNAQVTFFVDATTTATPEPATFGFAGGVVLALLGLRNMRRSK